MEGAQCITVKGYHGTSRLYAVAMGCPCSTDRIADRKHTYTEQQGRKAWMELNYYDKIWKTYNNGAMYGYTMFSDAMRMHDIIHGSSFR